MLLLDLEKVNATVGPGEAVMNTLIGMGTVFVVLILISIIIFLLKYVPKMFEKKKAEPEAAKQEKPAAKAVAKQEVPVSDNTQIIAVITADGSLDRCLCTGRRTCNSFNKKTYVQLRRILT